MVLLRNALYRLRLNKGHTHNIIGGVGTGPQGPCHPRTYGVPRMNIRSIMKMCCNSINSSTHSCNCKSILRCQERQSGGTECEKNFQRPGLRPGPHWGSLQRFPRPPSWWGERLAAPFQLSPAVGPLDLASPVTPLQNCTPYLIKAGDAPESYIGYD